MAKKRARRRSTRNVRASGNKIKRVFRKLLVFVILTVAALMLSSVASEMLKDLLNLLAFIFGFISIALLFVLFILGVMRILKK
jgi:Na+/H+-dicarboxylate symporter